MLTTPSTFRMMNKNDFTSYRKRKIRRNQLRREVVSLQKKARQQVIQMRPLLKKEVTVRTASRTKNFKTKLNTFPRMAKDKICLQEALAIKDTTDHSLCLKTIVVIFISLSHSHNLTKRPLSNTHLCSMVIRTIGNSLYLNFRIQQSIIHKEQI